MKILFVGTYLSHKKGSISIAEKLPKLFRNEYSIRLCSNKKNKLLRLIDILFKVSFFRGDLVVVDVYSGPAFLITYISSIVLKKIRKKKIVIVLRGGKLADFLDKHPYMMKTVLLSADKIVTPSLYLKDYFERNNFYVEYLPNFIMLDRFKPKSVVRRPFSLLWVRSFRHIYNPQLAILTLKILLKEYPEATLTMIGPDGGLLGECKKIIATSMMTDKVKIVGPVNNDELAEYYSSHAVYLNTTSYESFGMAVMEAAACGIPIVSTSVGEIPLLWKDGQDITLVADFSPESMAKSVSFLYSNPSKTLEIANKATEKANNFSWPVIRQKWIEIFHIQAE